MAANGMFGAGKDGMINPPDPDRHFSLSTVEVVVVNRDVKKIIRELKIVMDMAKVNVLLTYDHTRGLYSQGV